MRLLSIGLHTKKDKIMANYNFYNPYSAQTVNSTKPKTINIDSRCKEVYYNTTNMTVKSSTEEAHQQHVFWNYMMNVSMQNTLVQMSKR